MQFLETLFLFLDPIVGPATMIFGISITVFWFFCFAAITFLGGFSRKLERYVRDTDEDKSVQPFVMFVGFVGLVFMLYFVLLSLSWFYVFVWGLF